MNYLILFSLWIFYFIIHSALAADSVKLLFQRSLGRGYRYYRIFYSAISGVGMLVILYYQASMPATLLFAGSGFTRYLSLMIATLGIIIISRAFKEHRFLSFIGLKEEVNEFKRSGILNYVRHPIYSGTILIAIGFFLFNPSLAALLSVGCVLLYLPIGIHFEEKKLIATYGDAYLSYKREVPSLIPKFRRK
jgi:methanethiol S-methyltransferase